MRDMDGVHRVVVKIGTTSITDDVTGRVDRTFMDRVAHQVCSLMSDGIEVILVSSGAIGIGLQYMDVDPKPREIPIRQAAASVGQGMLMMEWCRSFREHDVNVAQILLTYDFYSDRERYLNLRNNISILLENGVVPVINENDAICINEIGSVFGDNDTLSAMVASKVGADLLLILSDVDGLYDMNPKRHADAHLIPMVEDITPEIESYGGDPTSTKGIGGMRTKIEAAKICVMSGCHMVIANHETPDVIRRTLDGEDIGTMFLSGEELKRDRTRWIVLASSSGTIEVDPGAMRALIDHNGLLPAGVVGVRGDFARGDVVRLESEGVTFAKGITEYTSDELRRVMGAHSDEIESLLGYSNFTNVMKRDNMGLIDP